MVIYSTLLRVNIPCNLRKKQYFGHFFIMWEMRGKYLGRRLGGAHAREEIHTWYDAYDAVLSAAQSAPDMCRLTSLQDTQKRNKEII